MTQKKTDSSTIELTPLEKIESLYDELVDWYGEADKKEQRVAAKLLMVSLEKLAIYHGIGWDDLVMEYVTILKKDPQRFQKIMTSNRGELKVKNTTILLH